MEKFIFFTLLLLTLPSFAVDHVGRIVKIEGHSKVYIPEASLTKKDEMHIRFRDRLYRVTPAQRGMKLENGYVVNTGPASKLKVIYNNGDHFFVAPNSQYVIEWSRPSLKDKEVTVMNVIRGAVRSVVEKDGPRTGMEVRTKSTTFGVRGTEFWVSVLNSQSTEVSVLRGQIEIAEENKAPVTITKGEKVRASVDAVEKSLITQQDLKEISQDTLPERDGKVEDEALRALEKKALEVTVKDIKIYEPELFEVISKRPELLTGSEQLTELTLKDLGQSAPEAKDPPAKPSLKDLESSGDPYKKYLKED